MRRRSRKGKKYRRLNRTFGNNGEKEEMRMERRKVPGERKKIRGY